MKIGTRDVGPGHPVFIIAEIGSNHGGSLDRALALIDAAAEAGADAAKFQYFRVDRFLVPRGRAEELRKYELPDEWLGPLFARTAERGIEFLCTAFDIESLDAINPFVDAHKVGSYEAARFDFLNAVADKQKPMLVSDGRTDPRPIRATRSDTSMIVLRCVSRYPAPIAGYLSHYGVDSWGVSDHTLHPTIVPAAAVALGACVVEKHAGFEAGLPDAAVSLGWDDFARMVEAIRLTESAVRG